MVKIGLQIKAQLENVTNLLAAGEDFRWFLKTKCASCGEVSSDFQYVTQVESAPLKGGRGSASMVTKCKLCSRENSIDILKDTIKPYSNDSGQFQTIVAFDCRGLEPVEFEARGGWTVEHFESGASFDDVSLVENEWADFDERSGEPVGITELAHQFIKVK